MEQTPRERGGMPLEDGRWLVDRVHSTVGFTVIDSADLKIVAGRFTDFAGEVLVQEGRATISGSLQTASINTDDRERDDHLRSADYLDADTHPRVPP